MQRFKRLVVLIIVAAIGVGALVHVTTNKPRAAIALDAGIHKIKHVVIIMQENRSFDSYFGTYPGADGIPPAACIPAAQGGCVRPYHDPNDRNAGGPHGENDAIADINGGRMDGFLLNALGGRRGCRNLQNPACINGGVLDVAGYHDQRELPNYWAYARNFVLQDHLFQPNASWSLPQHLFMVSEWSALCSRIGDPMSCVSALQNPDNPRDFAVALGARTLPDRPDYAWTDLTYLLHRKHVSGPYYVMGGYEPDCPNDAAECAPRRQNVRTPGIWNPLPSFDTVKA
ncbi:MAG: phospholipase, partial [Candidatus Eremiobacteraeota bacterium]|nr:phospholipase [Candidatus Eremiobacteraeota bacterium]